MKVISISLTFFNIYVALNTVPSTALRGDPRELRPKSIKAEIGTDASTSNSNEPVIVHADDSKHPRSVPKNAPSNANNEAYAALINEQDVVEFNPVTGGNLFASEEASGQTYRAKGAELLTRDGVDSVLIKPEEMEDCDSGMAKTGADSSTCKEVLDTTMEGGGISVESKIGNEGGSPKEEQYGEELYIQELHSLTRPTMIMKLSSSKTSILMLKMMVGLIVVSISTRAVLGSSNPFSVTLLAYQALLHVRPVLMAYCQLLWRQQEVGRLSSPAESVSSTTCLKTRLLRFRVVWISMANSTSLRTTSQPSKLRLSLFKESFKCLIPTPFHLTMSPSRLFLPAQPT